VLVGSPFGFWFSWSIGAYVAECFLTGKAQALARNPLWLWVLLFIGAALVRPLEPFCFPIAAVFTASWIASWLSLPRTFDFGKLPLYRHLCFVGVVSYSLYLLHQPILQHIGWLMSGHLSFYPILILSLLVWFPLLGISWVFHKFVELPSIEWGKAILRKRRAAAPQAPTSTPIMALRPEEKP
jgi:peptidoglycan/LPS O-acetylase OafA/YrhL